MTPDVLSKPLLGLSLRCDGYCCRTMMVVLFNERGISKGEKLKDVMWWAKRVFVKLRGYNPNVQDSGYVFTPSQNAGLTVVLSLFESLTLASLTLTSSQCWTSPSPSSNHQPPDCCSKHAARITTAALQTEPRIHARIPSEREKKKGTTSERGPTKLTKEECPGSFSQSLPRAPNPLGRIVVASNNPSALH